MIHLIKSIKLFLLFLCINSSLNLQASQVIIKDFKSTLKQITHVCVIKVDKFDKKMTYHTFHNGVKRLQSITLSIEGNIIEQFKGNIKAKKMKASFTQMVPIKYDKNGEKLFHFSYEAPFSGEEFNTKVGESYIFSFNKLVVAETQHYYIRMDLLKDKHKILKAIKEKDNIK